MLAYASKLQSAAGCLALIQPLDKSRDLRQFLHSRHSCQKNLKTMPGRGPYGVGGVRTCRLQKPQMLLTRDTEQDMTPAHHLSEPCCVVSGRRKGRKSQTRRGDKSEENRMMPQSVSACPSQPGHWASGQVSKAHVANTRGKNASEHS